MVVHNSTNGSSGSIGGSRNPLMQLLKLQQANIQRQTHVNTQDQHHEKKLKNHQRCDSDLEYGYIQHSTSIEDESMKPKRFPQLDISLSTTSSSSLDNRADRQRAISIRSNMQEKIFKASCDESKQRENNEQRRQSHHSRPHSQHQRTRSHHEKTQSRHQKVHSRERYELSYESPQPHHQRPQYHMQRPQHYYENIQPHNEISQSHYHRPQNHEQRPQDFYENTKFRHGRPQSLESRPGSFQPNPQNYQQGPQLHQQRHYSQQPNPQNYHQRPQPHQQMHHSQQLSPQNNHPRHQSQHHSRSQSSNPRNQFDRSRSHSSYSNGSNSNSESPPKARYHQGRYQYSSDEDWADSNILTSNVLHLKESVLNESNENNYIQSRGRMEPMNWSDVDKSSSSGRRTPVKKMMTVEDRSKKIIETKPAPRSEFLSFIENSIDELTVYEVNGNLVGSLNVISERPLLRIQRMLKKKTEHTVIIPKEIQQIMKQERVKKHHLIDKIDTPNFNVLQTNVPTSSSRPVRDEQTVPKVLENKTKESTSTGAIKKEPVKRQIAKPVEKESEAKAESINSSVTSMKKKQLILKYRKSKEKVKSELETSYDASETLGVLSKTEGVVKYQKRQQEFDKYDDDLFSFAKSTSTSNGDTSFASAKDDGLFVSKHSSNMVPGGEEKYRERRIHSFDSTSSLERSLEFDELSVSKRSSSFDALKQTLPKASSLRSSKILQNMKMLNSKSVAKKLIETLNSSELDSQTDSDSQTESKVIKIKNIEVCLKEDLLVAKETRYFKKTDTVNKESNAPDSTQLIEKQKENSCGKILQSQPSKSQTVDQGDEIETIETIHSSNDQHSNELSTADKTTKEIEDSFKSQLEITTDDSYSVTQSSSSFLSDENEIETHAKTVESPTSMKDDPKIKYEDHETLADNCKSAKEISSKIIEINVREDEEKNKNQSGKMLDISLDSNINSTVDDNSNHKVTSDEGETSKDDDDNDVEQYHVKEPLTIEEINSDTEEKENHSPAKTKNASFSSNSSHNNSAAFDEYDDGDGFDIVNFGEFDMFKNMVGKLQGLQAVQKAHALGILDNDESNPTCEDEINNTSNKISNKSSSLEISYDTYSSSSANNSTNVDSDEGSCNNKVSELVKKEENIFGNVKIDLGKLNRSLDSDASSNDTSRKRIEDKENNSPLIQDSLNSNRVKKKSSKSQKKFHEKLREVPKNDEVDRISDPKIFSRRDTNSAQSQNGFSNTNSMKTTKPAAEEKRAENESGESKRMMKLKRAINGYQKPTKQNGAEENQKAASPAVKRPQILEEIKKRNLHLSVRTDMKKGC